VWWLCVFLVCCRRNHLLLASRPFRTYDDHEWFDSHDGIFVKVASYTSSCDYTSSGKFAPQENNPLYGRYRWDQWNAYGNKLAYCILATVHAFVTMRHILSTYHIIYLQNAYISQNCVFFTEYDIQLVS